MLLQPALAAASSITWCTSNHQHVPTVASVLRRCSQHRRQDALLQTSGSSSRLARLPAQGCRRAQPLAVCVAAATTDDAAAADAAAAASAPAVADQAGSSSSRAPAAAQGASASDTPRQQQPPGAPPPAGRQRLSSSKPQPVRPALDRQAAQRRVEQRSQAETAEHLLTWRRRGPQPQAVQQRLLEQQEQQQQQEEGDEAGPGARRQQQVPRDAPAPEPELHPQQQAQQQRHAQGEQQPRQGQQGQFLTSPVSFVAATTHPKALAGSLAGGFALHAHQLMFAAGPLALAAAMKGLATVRGMVTAPPQSAGTGGGAAAGSGDMEPAYNILMQPTIRSRAAGRNAFALDIARVGPLPLSGGAGGPPGAPANAARVHVTSSSNELAVARALVDNMPARGQTALRVAGPYAVENAVLAVALARPLMRAACGQDLAVLAAWDASRAHGGARTGLLLSVYRCQAGAFPPRVIVDGPPSANRQRRAEYWERRVVQQRQRQRRAQQARKQQQQQQAAGEAAGGVSS